MFPGHGGYYMLCAPTSHHHMYIPLNPPPPPPHTHIDIPTNTHIHLPWCIQDYLVQTAHTPYPAHMQTCGLSVMPANKKRQHRFFFSLFFFFFLSLSFTHQNTTTRWRCENQSDMSMPLVPCYQCLQLDARLVQHTGSNWHAVQPETIVNTHLQQSWNGNVNTFFA